jgi:hypothetical protein
MQKNRHTSMGSRFKRFHNPVTGFVILEDVKLQVDVAFSFPDHEKQEIKEFLSAPNKFHFVARGIRIIISSWFTE